MVKIYLSPSNQPANKYAVGNTNEKAQCEDIANRVKKLLDEGYICETVMATYSLPITALSGRPAEAQRTGCDVYLAIHSNAGGDGTASGAVALYHPKNTQSHGLASVIVDELNAICPIPSTRSQPVADGMKPFKGKGLGEVRSPYERDITGVIAEVNFHDNPVTARYIIDNKQEIAEALVKAVASYYGLERKDSDTIYRVQVGAFRNKKYAEALLDKIRELAPDAYITEGV